MILSSSKNSSYLDRCCRVVIKITLNNRWLMLLDIFLNKKRIINGRLFQSYQCQYNPHHLHDHYHHLVSTYSLAGTILRYSTSFNSGNNHFNTHTNVQARKKGWRSESLKCQGWEVKTSPVWFESTSLNHWISPSERHWIKR